MTALVSCFLALLVALPCYAVSARLLERLELSQNAFKELMESRDQSVPQDLLNKCEAIVIFPRTLNIAWGLGGQYGKGVLLRHDREKHDWGNPAFYTIGGITLGPQIGGQAVDIVLVIMNQRGLNSILQSKSTLGGDAGIALGPVGRNATASTDLGLQAEIYSYSRAKGLYIGLSLKGAMVAPDKVANMEYYGIEHTPRDIILLNKGKVRDDMKPLLDEVRRHTPGWKPASPAIWVWAGAGALVLLAAIFFFVRKK